MIATFSLSSCICGMFEEEIEVIFKYEDEVIASDKVTQFKNIHTPMLDETYIYDGYKFYGWTALNVDNIRATDSNFKEEFIGDGKMVHYMDVKPYEKDGKVVLNALFIDKEEIPKVYHYAVIAWYSEAKNSGMNSDQIATLETKLKDYLRSEGVSDEDIATIIIRGYSGNVGTSCSSIMADEDVDIMLGWGSVDNVTNTGGIKESMLLETVSQFKVDYNGQTKYRTIHRLSDSETVIKVMEWMKSAECRNIFYQEANS